MNWKCTLAVLTLNVLLISSSYTLIMPFLPYYLVSELNCPNDALPVWSGLCYASTFVVSAASTILWGRFADNTGKKKMLVRVSLLLTLAYLFCMLSKTPLQLMLSRAFQGLASGMTPAVLSLASCHTPKSKNGLAMGVIQSANILGTILGPLIGGVLAQTFGVRFCFLITSCMVSIVTALNVLLIKDPTSPNETMISPEASSIKLLIKNKVIITSLLLSFFSSSVIMLLVPIISLRTGELLKNSETIAVSGVIFSLSGLAGVIASPLWGHFGHRYGRFKVLLLSSFAGAMIFLLQSTSTEIITFAILQFAGGLCICAAAPSLNSMLSVFSSENDRTKAFALLYTAQQLGNCSGPVIGSLVGGLYSLQEAFLCASLLQIFSFSILVLSPQAFKKL